MRGGDGTVAAASCARAFGAQVSRKERRATMLNACGEYRSRLVELARGHAGPDERRLLLAHAERCAECARALDEQLALSAALGTLADAALPEIAEIEARVLAEFDGRARWSWRRRIPVAALLASAAAIGFLWVNRGTPVVR